MTPPFSRSAIAAPPSVCASFQSQAPDSWAMIGPRAAPFHDLIISGGNALPCQQTSQRHPSEPGLRRSL